MSSKALANAQIYHFRYQLTEPVETVMSPLTARSCLLLRIEDEDGAFGWGEIWCNFPPDGDYHRARLAAKILPEALKGILADEAEPFIKILSRFHRLIIQCGEPGPVAQIVSAIDIALHDMQARYAKVPLAVYLGGNSSAVPAYASGINPYTAAKQIERMRSIGYSRFKQRIGFGPADGIKAAKETFDSLKSEELFMLDANQAWDYAVAIQKCEQLKELDLFWLEEPIAADASEADWSRLSKCAPMKLAGGENLTGEALKDSVKLGALSVIQPDICKWGGLSFGMSIARAAVDAERIYCPHCLGSGVGLTASAHLLSAVGGGGMLEVDSSDNPFISAFSWQGLGLEDGTFSLSDAPGLGFEPNIELAEEFLVQKQEICL